MKENTRLGQVLLSKLGTKTLW